MLELEVVTGSADVVRIGHRTAKGVAGYDLVSLLVGSEGTLGIVTEITVRLRSLPSAPITVAGFFPSLVTAGAAVRAVGAAGITPSALELMDRFCLRAVDEWKQMGLTAAGDVLLLARVDDPEPTGTAHAEAIVELFRASGASWAERSSDAGEADALFAARRLAYPALERLGPVITEDVCVPKEHVPEMLARIEALAARHGVQIANIAHAGDGNLHPLIIGPPDDDADQWLRIHARIRRHPRCRAVPRRHHHRRARRRPPQARWPGQRTVADRDGTSPGDQGLPSTQRASSTPARSSSRRSSSSASSTHQGV